MHFFICPFFLNGNKQVSWFSHLVRWTVWLSLILLSMLTIKLSILSVIRYLICGNNLNWFPNLNLIYETLWTGARVGLLILILGKLSCYFFDQPNNTGSTDTKMDVSVLEEKSSFKILGLTLSSKLDWSSYIISVAKTISKKIGSLICSMKCLSPEVVLYLYKSIIHSCMEYCCHIWTGTLSCYLELLSKLDKQICWTVGPSLAASPEPLTHLQNVVSSSLFYRYYITLVHVLQNWFTWFYFLSHKGGLVFILTVCMIFLSPFLDVTKMSVSTVSFLAHLDSGIICQ